MAGSAIASAFVQLVPKMPGLSEEIGKAAGADGTSYGSGFKSAVASTAIGTALGGMLAQAASSAMGAVKDIVGTALGNTAQYEQLVGGVETLFKGSAGAVKGYAEEAYRTAGMSANQYMETVTSFSASLIQSMGGDTDAAAQKANTAITDMADNANKMGSSMESIQNAYQGFAKGNMTMLDNLKLGYGGTAQEMKRLLSDAEKISGIKYDISSYADIVDAIHVVQENMGIAGATAAEAAGTIEGSVNTMKSAWDNWLTGLGTGADMGALTDNLMTSITNVVNNVVPAIGRIVPALVTGISTALPSLVTTIGSTIGTLMPTIGPALMQAGSSLFTFIVDGLSLAIPNITAAIPGFVMQVGQFLISAAPTLLGAAMTLFSSLVQGLIAMAPNLIAQLPTLIISFVTTLGSYAPTLFAQAGQLFTSIVNALPTILGALIGALYSLLSNLPGAIQSFAGTLGTAAGNLFKTIVDAVPKILGALLGALGNLLSNLPGKVASFAGQMAGAAKDMIMGMVSGIGDAAGWVINAIGGLCSNALGAVKSFFGIASPSKLMRKTFGYVGEGAALGIADSAGLAVKAMRDMGEEVEAAAKPAVSVGAYAANPANFAQAAKTPPAEAQPQQASDVDRLVEALSSVRFVVDLDGEELAARIAPAMDDALGRRLTWGATR